MLVIPAPSYSTRASRMDSPPHDLAWWRHDRASWEWAVRELGSGDGGLLAAGRTTIVLAQAGKMDMCRGLEDIAALAEW